jgi:hypothetical protein
MSIVVRFPLSNVTKQQYDSVHAALEQSGDWPAVGCLIHVVFGDEQNVRVSEIWESQEQLQAFGEKLQPKLAAAGIVPGEPEIFGLNLKRSSHWSTPKDSMATMLFAQRGRPSRASGKAQIEDLRRAQPAPAAAPPEPGGAVRRGWKIVIGVLTAIVVLVVVNTIVTDRDTEPAKADGGRLIDLPGGALQVREDGPVNDPPIVLIHGWAASSDWFDRITPLLATGHHVVRVDLLGHGGSAKPRNGYTMEEQADRVALALDRLGVRRALVAGHSTGGEVAIALAARHPELARRLAIIDTEPDEKYVDTDTLGDLSVTPVIGETMKRLATDGTRWRSCARRSRRASTPRISS